MFRVPLTEHVNGTIQVTFRQLVPKDPSFLLADREDSDQTGRMPRLISVFAGRTCHFVGFVMRRLNCFVSFGFQKAEKRNHSVKIILEFHFYINFGICHFSLVVENVSVLVIT